MRQHDVALLIDGRLREVAIGADNWPWAWVSGICESSGSVSLEIARRLGRERHFELDVLIDRDHADRDRARGMASALEAWWSVGHPGELPIALLLYPTTRLEHARALVDDHFETCVSRDADQMMRNGESWVTVSEIAIARGWSGELDRITVTMYADSSADEAAAAALGERWLARLTVAQPELSGIVTIIGSSH